MKWEEEAKARLVKIPFFIRKRVKGLIEGRVHERGADTVTTLDVEESRSFFLKKTDRESANANKKPNIGDSKEAKLWEIAVCRGAENDCPFVIKSAANIKKEIAEIFTELDFSKKRKKMISGLILPHHRFKVSISTCPNGCSKPQIKDIGIFVQVKVSKGSKTCKNCGLCVETCKEDAIIIREKATGFEPVFDYALCQNCGLCANVCPVGTIETNEYGFRLLVGGKLGRHPKLAKEILPFCTKGKLLNKVRELIELYLKEAAGQDKMADVLNTHNFK